MLIGAPFALMPLGVKLFRETPLGVRLFREMPFGVRLNGNTPFAPGPLGVRLNGDIPFASGPFGVRLFCSVTFSSMCGACTRQPPTSHKEGITARVRDMPSGSDGYHAMWGYCRVSGRNLVR